MVLKDVNWDNVDWTHLAEDRDQWPDIVNKVMNLRVPQNAENVFDGQLSASGLSSIPLFSCTRKVVLDAT
jgi:hypothetical protein